MAPGGATTHNIQQLKGILNRQPIDRKLGPVADRISKLLVYGDQQMPDAQIKIGEIGKSINDFARRRREEKKPEEKFAKEGNESSGGNPQRLVTAV